MKLFFKIFALLLMINPLKNFAQEQSINVAILVYEGVYLLDFAGPMEVFNDAGIVNQAIKINLFTVSIDGKKCAAHTGLQIQPTYSLKTCPPPDILVIPGGDLNLSKENKDLQEWLVKTTINCKLVLSVCTGAFILAHIGLLDGMEVTTWHGALKNLQKIAPNSMVVAGVRYTDNDKLVTTAGISAGIDGSLYVIEKLFGKESALKTAEFMDYEYWGKKD